MSDEPKRPTIVVQAPPFTDEQREHMEARFETERREALLPPETGLRQILTALPEMPLEDFLRLFILDNDLGIRFVREINGERVHVGIQYRLDGNLDIAIGLERKPAE
jgi:hypothetical protein